MAVGQGKGSRYKKCCQWEEGAKNHHDSKTAIKKQVEPDRRLTDVSSQIDKVFEHFKRIICVDWRMSSS